MPAPKSSLVSLFPSLLIVPLILSSAAQAQEKTAANPDSKTASPASLTKPTPLSSSIASRQSLPAFTSIKASVSPVATPPQSQPITPPVPVKEAALPTLGKPRSLATLSPRQSSKMVTAEAVTATPPVSVVRQRRAFGQAVSLSSSPNDPIELAPQIPVATAPVKIIASIAAAPAVGAVSAIEPLPRIEAPPVAKPSALASREARARELTLARLDAQLAGAEAKLDRAQDKLTEGQRQLGSVNGLLQNAMLTSGGSGLHPFVRVAQRYLGTPYVWGGESARGFDCSGFIMRVMRDLGYKALPHSAAEQFNYGKPIAKNLLQPGDIVFFANTYKPGISHVGIYLGNGRFIHAANSQVGTIVSNLNQAKWVAKYAGARRLVKTS